MSLGPELSRDSDQIVSGLICLGYQIHIHRAGGRTPPTADLRAAIDWVRRVMASNAEMQLLADFIERECSPEPQRDEHADR